MKKREVDAEALLVAIRRKCLECSGGYRAEVEACRITGCPLHPYRNTRAIDNKHSKGGETP